jgi:hypothetical protein
MKDGSGSCEVAGQTYEQTASGATCQRLEDVYQSNGSCTGNVGKECIWRVVAPNSCVPGANEERTVAEEPAAEEPAAQELEPAAAEEEAVFTTADEGAIPLLKTSRTYLECSSQVLGMVRTLH